MSGVRDLWGFAGVRAEVKWQQSPEGSGARGVIHIVFPYLLLPVQSLIEKLTVSSHFYFSLAKRHK